MNLNDFLDVIKSDLIATRYACQDGRWCVHIEHCEIREGGLLASAHGNAKNVNDATNDYIRQIRGKTILIDGLSSSSKEYHVPENIDLIGDY